MEAAAAMNMQRSAVLLAVALIVIAIVLRIVPHPANFAPVAAVAIFGGAVLPRKFALWAPLMAMVISDAVIGFYDIMPVIWGCYLVIALASSFWLRRLNFTKTMAVTLGASVFFFVITNFAVWVTSGMYDHTFAGLMQCYTIALPFFRNTILSDAIYTAGLFGLYRLVYGAMKHMQVSVERA